MKRLQLNQVQHVCGGAATLASGARDPIAINPDGARGAAGVLESDPIGIEGPSLSGPQWYSGLPLTSCPVAQSQFS